MKCDSCKKKMEETFMNKIVGTIIKDQKGKKHNICPECQKKHSKEELLKKI